MRRFLATVVTSGLASLAVLGMSLTPAHAETSSRPTLILTIADGESPQPWDRAASLFCRPPGGTHPEAAAACSQLDRVGGDIDALSAQPMLCTYEYAPVTVTARGHWDDREIDYRETFANRCVMLRETGAVFAF